jgi:hypothetical protein
VLNGLILPHSSGAIEGNVNRIKMIKRQMYGRASFDLLRKRVILAAREGVESITKCGQNQFGGSVRAVRWSLPRELRGRAGSR